jgi:hypothetical protein
MKKIVQKSLIALASIALAGQYGVAQNFPKDGTVAQEIAIGGPSIDYLTLEFPRPGVAKCNPHTETRTIAGDLAKGKALLVVIFPKDCPHCITAADKADPMIAKYRDKLTLWYVNQRLNGEGSCNEITDMKNKYPFVKGADFAFIDIYMINAPWGFNWHYAGQDSYFSRPGAPSVYRIFDPITKKVTGIDYNFGTIESQVQAAIKNNFTPTGAERATDMLMSYELFPNPSKENVWLHANLKESSVATISIKNKLGVELLNKQVSGSSIRENLDLTNLNTDMYMLSVTVDGIQIINDKIVKQ